jgi:transposase-like protein
MQPLCQQQKEKSFYRLMDEKACYQVLRENRWPDSQVRCPYCDGTSIAGPWPVPYQPACHRYRCRTCERYFNDRTGTVFEKSKLPLGAWFLAIYLVELNKSAAEIARELPCDYHTAYNIAWLVREGEISLEEGRRLKGVIEVDEIYQTAGHKGRPPAQDPRDLGRPPRRRGKKKGRGRGSAAKDTPAIIGMVSRSGDTLLAVTEDVRRESLEPVFQQGVEEGSTIYSDSASCYRFLEEVGYDHDTVNHSAREYARGEVHQNRSEALWSLWRPFIAIFRGVAQRNLPAYAQSFQFRRNHRRSNAYGRMEMILPKMISDVFSSFCSYLHSLLAFFDERTSLSAIPI